MKKKKKKDPNSLKVIVFFSTEEFVVTEIHVSDGYITLNYTCYVYTHAQLSYSVQRPAPGCCGFTRCESESAKFFAINITSIVLLY